MSIEKLHAIYGGYVGNRFGAIVMFTHLVEGFLAPHKEEIVIEKDTPQ
jgi:hypothetical protein